MEDEKRLVYAAVAVLVFGAIIGVAVSAYTEEPVSEGEVRVTGTDIQLGNVTGETVELGTVVRLTHRGGVTENVSVVVRATRTDTGLLAVEERKEIGDIEGSGEQTVNVPVVVEREGDYELEVAVYEGSSRVGSGSARVSGVGTVKPEYATSNLRFHSFPFQPAVEFSVASSGENAELRTVSYLTNEGDTSETARLVVKARQAQSGIVAAEESTEVTVGAGSTATPTVRLTVPNGYDYYLDATLWQGQNIVATHRSTADLDPNQTIQANRTVRDTGLRVEEFETGRRELDEMRGRNATGGEPDEGMPGFGVGVAVIALTAVALARRRLE